MAREISRRSFVTKALMGGVGVGAAALLASCGTTVASGDTGATEKDAAAGTAATAPSKVPEITIPEISRHPSELPRHANFTLYKDGQYQNPVERRGPITQEVHFTIKEGRAEIMPGTIIDFWTFDAGIPGPMIRGRVDDTIDFYLHNPKESQLPHNVDFHAVTGPGGGAVRLDTAPGAVSNLRFKLLNPGIYIYHCAWPDIPTHIAHGMYGLIVVEPEEGLPEVDHEFYFMQSEFYTELGGGDSATNLKDKGYVKYSGEMGNMEQPTFVTFNGRPNSLTGDRAVGVYGGKPIKTGETVRLFVGNIGPGLASSFHVIGEIFDKVYVEGSFDLVNRNVQTTLIPAGGAVGVEFTPEVPGEYIPVDHSIFRIHKGALGVIQVEGPENPEVYQSVKYSDELR